tara:strand:- start:23347 stop:23451 length:105 start_codon:yes stop_codon:yes gene_type:complete
MNEQNNPLTPQTARFMATMTAAGSMDRALFLSGW